MKKCKVMISMRDIFGFNEEVEIGSDRYNELRRVNELYESNETLCREITSLRNTVRVLSQNIVSANVDDVNFIHELENQITELRNQLKVQQHKICKKIIDFYREHQLIMEQWLIDCLDQIERGER